MNAQTFTHAEAVEILKAHYNVESDDMKTIINNTRSDYHYSETVHAKALEFMSADTLRNMLRLPQKQIKRFVQMMYAISASKVTSCDYTHARLLISLRAAGEYSLNRDALHALTSNTISATANTRGISRSRINEIFKLHHGASTVDTKLSNSAGKNGYMTSAGMLQTKGMRNAEVSINYASPIIAAFFNMVDTSTEGQLQELADKGEKKRARA